MSVNTKSLNDLAYSATIQKYGLNPTDIIVGKKYMIIEKNGMTSLLGKCVKIDFDAGNYQNDFSSKWVCIFEEDHPLNQPIYGYNNQKINILEDDTEPPQPPQENKGGKYKRKSRTRKSRTRKSKTRKSRKNYL